MNAADYLNAADFFAASRVLIVAGKGGVGKTTLGATLGIAAASVGLKTQLVELDGPSSLGSPFGLAQLPYEETTIELVKGPLMAPLSGRRITADNALVDYLGTHGLQRISNRLLRSGAIDAVSTAAPGIQDLLALGKIRAMESERKSDLIVVDAPSTGHAMTFLTSAAGFADAIDDGPVHDQAALVLEMLADPRRCQVMLITLAEETPVNETIETAYLLEEEVEIKLSPIVVNGLVPNLAGLSDALLQLEGSSAQSEATRAAANYRLRKQTNQSAECDRLASELPIPQIRLDQLVTSNLGQDDIATLACQFNKQASGLVSQ